MKNAQKIAYEQAQKSKNAKAASDAKKAAENIKSTKGNVDNENSSPKKGAIQKPGVPTPGSSSMTFSQAFANARKNGSKTFSWTNPKTGKTGIYGTKLKSEVNEKVNVKPKSTPNVTPKSEPGEIKRTPQTKTRRQMRSEMAQKNMDGYQKQQEEKSKTKASNQAKKISMAMTKTNPTLTKEQVADARYEKNKKVYGNKAIKYKGKKA